MAEVIKYSAYMWMHTLKALLVYHNCVSKCTLK